MSLTMLHEIGDVHFQVKPNPHGGTWLIIMITNREGRTYEVDCFPDGEPISITFGPDNIPIDDKLASE